jgi:CRP-like cAMP-binding protein
MFTPLTPKQNHLLAALPEDVFKRLFPHLELVSLPLGEVIYESGGQLQHVYFPTTAIISLHYVMKNGASTEIAGVGNEGVLGISLFMGGKTTPSRATVQNAGYGYRLKGRLMMEEFNRVGGRRSGTLQNLLLRYTQALITQMSQTAVCNRYHSVEQQLCRCLLSTFDRLHSSELTMTQELIAGMLGVRREGITETAGNLQRAGLISYRRGHITVLNRSGLESRTCECYSVVKKEFQRLFSDTVPNNSLPNCHSAGANMCDARIRQEFPSASHANT